MFAKPFSSICDETAWLSWRDSPEHQSFSETLRWRVAWSAAQSNKHFSLLNRKMTHSSCTHHLNSWWKKKSNCICRVFKLCLMRDASSGWTRWNSPLAHSTSGWWASGPGHHSDFNSRLAPTEPRPTRSATAPLFFIALWQAFRARAKGAWDKAGQQKENLGKRTKPKKNKRNLLSYHHLLLTCLLQALNIFNSEKNDSAPPSQGRQFIYR